MLGIEDFGDRGPVVRVWIKTQPIKQWDVSREFHRRLKLAFDEANISIPANQQEIWFQTGPDMRLQLNGLNGNGEKNKDRSKQETVTAGATPEPTGDAEAAESEGEGE